MTTTPMLKDGSSFTIGTPVEHRVVRAPHRFNDVVARVAYRAGDAAHGTPPTRATFARVTAR
jgi:hypothetical protein